MKFKDIKVMNSEDLLKKETELKKELIKLNAQVATGTTPQNSGRLKQIKKILARGMTARGQRSQWVKYVQNVAWTM